MIDVLIIGSGGAGLSAAIEAKKTGATVLVVSKTYPTSSQTTQAQGGINSVVSNKKDSIDLHIKDTKNSAKDIGDDKAIEFMCKEAPNSIRWLDDLGVPFSRDKNNNIAQRSLGGASYPRACFCSDYSGLKILHTLYDNCIKENIEFLNEHLVLNFIKENDTIKGVVVFDIKDSKIKQILAKTVIIASGGYGGIFNGYTTNSTATTGEILNIALNIGCELENMEYIQFHPTALKDSCILISESARGEGGYLVNQDEERFVDELLPRDIVARSIFQKIQKGDKIYLDLRHLGLEKIKEFMPQEYKLAYDFTGKYLDKDLLEINPAVHYTMGGIKTDIYGQTNIKNLYAVGECASCGVHGANRLGGNSLLEIVTFGRMVGKNCGYKKDTIDNNYNKDNTNKEITKIENIYNLPNNINFQTIKKDLGNLMYKDVGLFRDDMRLNLILKQLNIWKDQLIQMGIEDKSKIYNSDLKEFLEFKNSLELSFAIVLSALNRKESRGAHYRTDFEETDIEYSYSTVIYKNNNKLEIK
jgi:succinate dehydrogenase / fumarate reductase flavoprotein subunit